MRNHEADLHNALAAPGAKSRKKAAKDKFRATGGSTKS